MNYKAPLSSEEQVEYLEKYKRVKYNYTDKQEAAEFLYTHNYINVISPFKYQFAAKNEDGTLEKKNGRHVYPDNVEFNEYKRKYIVERSLYPSLFLVITRFETIFNSIVSNEILCHYSIDDDNKFESFIYEVTKNICDLHHVDNKRKTHMLQTVIHFKNDLSKYNSPYIFMDRLSLSQLSTIYLAVDEKLSQRIFSELLSRGLTLGYTRKTDFDHILTILVQVRNCIMHGNSLTVLIRYYDVKTKKLRNRTNRRRYEVLITKLCGYSFQDGKSHQS